MTRRRSSLCLIAVSLALGAVGSCMEAAGAVDEDSSAVTVNKTVTRVNYINGHDVPVDSRSVSLTVATTKDLRSRQEVSVSWTGAHPTGGSVADENSANAALEEYPMVIMECRGVDDPSAPAAQQISPSTCWTQSPQERYVDNYNTDDPVYRQDRYASPANRAPIVGVPSGKLPPVCQSGADSAYWLHFVSADGTDYPGGPSGCPLTAPEETTSTTSLRPGNTTYAATKTDGTGSTDFTMWTTEDNASLGCTDTVACTLVAVPIMGISCDPDAAMVPASAGPEQAGSDDAAACEATGKQTPGSYAGSGVTSLDVDASVTGSYWWSASNWRGRLSVPLSFAPLANVCDLVSNENELDIYGSELMTQAMQQWSPYFCLQPNGFKIKHVQTEEPQARNLVSTGQVESGLISDGPDGGFAAPTVSAPTAVTGFVVGFKVDGADGAPEQSLQLDARLLAKLLTESYPDVNDVKSDDVDLAGNPLNISDDPEFQALNPTVSAGSQQLSAATLTILSSDSDVVRNLTSYVLADPAAKAWLDGVPDPWGMKVNPNYRIDFPEAQLTLPTYTWPLLDTFERKVNQSINPCLADDPVPYLPLVAAPQQRLSLLSQDLQYDTSTAQTVCVQPNINSSDGEKLNAFGREVPGHRLLLAITSLPDADRYGLPVASLETASTVSPSTAFTTAAGQTFVLPTNDALSAAVGTATPDETTGVWTISSDTLRAVPTAYPGTMIVSTAIPTKGLSSADAADYSSYLHFVAGVGQTPGLGQGNLPPGYLPITAADGLGAFVAHTLAAADAVAAQQGLVPALIPAPIVPTQVQAAPTSATPSTSSRPVASAVPTESAAGKPGHAVTATPSPLPVDDALAGPGTTPSPLALKVTGLPTASTGVSAATVALPAAEPSSGPSVQAEPVGFTTGRSVGVKGAIIPLLLLIGLAAGLGGLLAGRRRASV